ncbi:glycosyltransferase [Psychroserpens algicola]|uniref:glycosyltransferase n=1 Tax=Psychroserpens algicola TaxID=1719034 RepID=UPI001953405F|nr:glycosyltransferase [Psychroserpens algicola]
MKILLVGEYNRSHKSLKEGLLKLGHEAQVVGLTDGFKKVDIDIEIKHKFKSGFIKNFKVLIYKLIKVDLHSLSVKKQIQSLKQQLSGHDIVQFVNESPFLCLPKTEMDIFDLLTSWNNKAFLLSCGTDHLSVKYAYEKKFRYSILTPYFENRLPKTSFALGLKYLEPDFVKLHNHIYNTIVGVISNDLDYTIPLMNHPRHLGLIPHAIHLDDIRFTPLTYDDKIVIFHGINRTNYIKKGNDIFEKALTIIKEKHPNKIDIITVEDVPYEIYIKAFDSAHILLDQVYAYDQGYNALEAMAKGKVVFTGAEQEWLDYYHLEEDTVAINALPDAHAIVKKLEWLIANPEKLIEISNNARAFVEREHHHVKNAERYLKIWKTS